VARADDDVAKLEAVWPEWHVWYVPLAVGGMTWCAHRRDDERHVINAGSPGELEALLALED